MPMGHNLVSRKCYPTHTRVFSYATYIRLAPLAALLFVVGCGRIGYLQLESTDSGVADTGTDGGTDGGTACDPASDIGPIPSLCPPGPPCPLLALDIAASSTHSCAVSTTGEVYCWGQNCSGQLGVGDRLTRLAPVRVTLPEAALEVAVGSGFSCALTTGGSIYCWGSNERGATGTDSTEPRLIPAGPIGGSPNLAQLHAASGHACSIDTSQGLRCWGSNSEGQLGIADPFPAPGIARFVPTSIGSASWSDMALSGGHSCGIQSDGTLHCTGRNVGGQLGIGLAAGGQLREFQAVGSDSDWLQVVAGQFNSCALKTDMQMFCWGDGTGGALGMGDLPIVEMPTLHGARLWRAVALSAFHGCGVDAAGDLYCWGRAVEGQLGVAQLDPELFPVASASDPGNVVGVATGRFSTYLITSDSRLFVTGANNLGHGLQTRLSAFTQLFLP